MILPRSHSSSGAVADFNPSEIRRLVQIGKDRGLIRGKDTATPIAKDGAAITQLGSIRSQWMDVDPVAAKKWLDNNFRNRPLKEDVVQAYARDMINGVWIATHQGVAFNDKDDLIDGQHRLHAIVLSGKTVRMMVTFGLPSTIAGSEMTTMDAVDRGRTRSVADQLTIQHGFKNGSITASICAGLSGVCYGARTRRLSVGHTLEIYRAYEQAIAWIIMHRRKEHGLKATGVLVGFVFAIATESEGLWDGSTPLQSMYERMVSGDDLAKGSAMELLRTFLLSPEAQLLTRGTDRGVAELVLQAIYLEQENKRVAKLEMSLDGVNHFRALQKDRVEKIANLFQLPKK